MSQSRSCKQCGATLPPEHDASKPCPRCLLALGRDQGAASVPTKAGLAPTVDELQPFFENLVIEELVGQGGMGAVYRARHKELDRNVALKVLTVVDDDPAFDERFAREARAMASLNHPNIAAVHDFGKAGEFTYLMLEFIDGVNVRDMIRSKKTSAREALSMVSQICSALQYAHDKGVVHRDIKPENILINKSGEVKLVDFGLAKLVGIDEEGMGLTGTHQAMGTFHYMAPEQYEKPLEVDHRADIFSLGVVFYELLTGELPVGRFAAPSEVVQIDVRLDEIVLRTLEKEPSKRYQRASVLQGEVDTISSSKLAPPKQAAAAAYVPERHPMSVGKIVLIILACFMGLPLALGCLFVIPAFLWAPLSVSETEPTHTNPVPIQVHGAPNGTAGAGADSPITEHWTVDSEGNIRLENGAGASEAVEISVEPITEQEGSIGAGPSPPKKDQLRPVQDN